MEYWRFKAISVVKYKREYYNEEGIYTNDEWTAYSDIGRSFNGKVFRREDYLKVENQYVEAVKLFTEFLGIDSLGIKEVFKTGEGLKEDAYSKDLLPYYELLKDRKNQTIEISQVEAVVRLILRNYLWNDLEHASGQVYFGYDYYMYFHSPMDLTPLKERIEGLGLTFG